MLGNFERDIDCIQSEKENQYRTMKYVIKIMNDYNDDEIDQEESKMTKNRATIDRI